MGLGADAESDWDWESAPSRRFLNVIVYIIVLYVFWIVAIFLYSTPNGPVVLTTDDILDLKKGKTAVDNDWVGWYLQLDHDMSRMMKNTKRAGELGLRGTMLRRVERDTARYGRKATWWADYGDEWVDWVDWVKEKRGRFGVRLDERSGSLPLDDLDVPARLDISDWADFPAKVDISARMGPGSGKRVDECGG